MLTHVGLPICIWILCAVFLLAAVRRRKRWTVTAACLLGILALAVTVKSIAPEREYPPIETASAADGENIYVDLDRVSDGCLHRFSYTTENGVPIRFAVVRQAESGKFFVGPDMAGEGGEAGSGEGGRQVVCDQCGIIMNVFPAGSGDDAAAAISYFVEDSRIVIPVSELLQYEDEFA